MIIKVPLQREYVSKFIVKNKWIEKQERIKWYQLPHLRTIRLFHFDTEYAYLPLGGNEAELPLFVEGSLSTPVVYTPPTITKNEEMYAAIKKEQDYVLSQVKLNNSWLIEMKTARGKWNTIMRITEYFQAKTLIVVHSQQTLIEMKEAFVKVMWCEDMIWVYYSAKKDIREITITTKKSLCENPELFAWKFSVVLVDEADQGLSRNNRPKKIDPTKKKKLSMIAMLCMIDCERIYWLTGTPEREDLDINDLQLLYWKLIRLEWQINNWYNYVPSIEQYTYTATNLFSYENMEEARQLIINDETRFRLQADLVVAKYNSDSFKYGIIMFDRVAQEANHYYEKFKELYPDLNLWLITGKTKPKNDKITIDDIKEKWKWLIICTKWKMGRWVDIPILDAVFIFFPWKLPSSVIQAVGRILRIDWEKQPIIYDRHDNFWIFKAQWKARILSYKKEYIAPKISIYNIKPIDESN